MAIGINCDMGESFGIYKMGNDVAIMPFVTIANVACGFHASDPSVMAQTVQLAKRHKVKVGAHPSLPDLVGFGRREMQIHPDEITDCIIYQVGALRGFLEREGVPLNHIKPHGALYGMAARSAEVASAIARAAMVFGVPLVGMSGTLQEEIYTAKGVAFIAEFYADLDYARDGSLIITREHAAVAPKVAAERVLRAIKDGVVKSIDGPDVGVRVESVCVHSDTPGAVEVAQAVHECLANYLD
ncbi:5-oxoprolinase subunit PxpA [Candidatus Binatus sp.]|uniref:5-oxoprolinase subunit PxpA n=1 Tax=Candidatus Binatus sp. TaxID=2811406 RepID=UPI003C3B1920